MIGFATLFKKCWASFAVAAVLFSAVEAQQNADDQSCRYFTPQFQNMNFRIIELVRSDGHTIRSRPKIADDSSERSAGFQYICPEIIDTSSILFVYEQPVLTRFHMFNVRADLDIGFFDEYGKLNALIHMKPQKRTDPESVTYGAAKEFKYALETRAGFFEENGLTPGSTTLNFP